MALWQGTMEDMGIVTASFWRGRDVLVTGHTGFKGSWLALWLSGMGARVHGFAVEPPTSPNLFETARVADSLCSDTRADLANLPALKAAVHQSKASIIFHLAAQSLVRESYTNPIETFRTNTLGTAHVLETVRSTPSIRAVVVVTTDKVYENREWLFPYRETDALGGRDPYSASKAAAEIIASAYRDSFFSTTGSHGACVATARAGNVIGGGDWAVDRLVPDAMRARRANGTLVIRNPTSTRPWQHVLDPLAGYLALAKAMLGERSSNFARSWNFGPDQESNATVGEMVSLIRRLGGHFAVELSGEATPPHEAGVLCLDSTLARRLLHWKPRWTLAESTAKTIEWYDAFEQGADMATVCANQIAEYCDAD